jgi:CheY-like chemotaxis protein
MQLLKAIRTGKSPASRDLPCAMLTSYAERHLVGLAIVLDVDTFLAKPVSLDVLNKHLGRIFQYRFEPQAVPVYQAVDVDNVAPHLTGDVKPLAFQDAEPVTEEDIQPLPLDEFDTQPPPAKPAAPEPARAAPSIKETAKEPAKAEPKPAAAAKTAAPTGKAIQVKLADVPEDAVLAKDLIGTGGTLLLSAGTPFKRRYVKRLEELQTFKETVDSVWIIEPEAA